MSAAFVTKIQRFSTHDGDGIRTVVFLKGCPLGCKWCHNPETKKAENQLYYVNKLCIACGSCKEICAHDAQVFRADSVHAYKAKKCMLCMRCVSACPTKAMESVADRMTSEQIMEIVCRDKPFYGHTGGLTLSGGEPLIHTELCMELLRSAKKQGFTTAIETCGFVNPEVIKRAVPLTDCFLWDIKDTDPKRHKENAGVDNTLILENLRLADALGAKTVLRCIVLRGVNAFPEHFQAVSEIYHSLQNCAGVELLPYHTYGGSKREQLDGFDDGNKAWIPDEKDLATAREVLTANGVDLRM
jgi:pyruvate formate lyase activating enzyme